MDLISFVLLGGGKSSRMGNQDKGLLKLNNKRLIQYVLDSIDRFLDILSLETQIPVYIVLHDFQQMEEYLNEVPGLKEEQFIIDEKIWYKNFTDVPQPPQNSIMGLWSALSALNTDYKNVFALPCDMPLISETVLSYIFNAFFKNFNHNHRFKKKLQNSNSYKYLSFIPIWENGEFEPFYSIFHIKSILPIIEKKLLNKQYSMQDIFSEILENPSKFSSDLKYEIQLNTISIEKELKKYDNELYNFVNIDSFENLKEAEKLILSKNSGISKKTV